VITTFDKTNFTGFCEKLASKDKDLGRIILQFGYPPLWKRRANFETLVHIILEQQVSLASAKAALDKLKLQIGIVSAQNLLNLSDAEMRSCYFSRQKTVYARHLAEEIISKRFSITGLNKMTDSEVSVSMKSIKGIGDWTSDVFMMMALQRTDRFPTGDIALIKSIRQVKRLADDCSKEKVLAIAEKWRPYRTIAAYLLWHNYLSQRKQKS
jgi:DNA-3-methyladenine glycosylase II